ncbi:MAG TPA: GNAT family N-acetyltransferase [Chitinophagales bacterium]|nr:GNAT family N-acetyltransferase [Chitinophagales bacterium]
MILRKALLSDQTIIWKILQHAIQQRKEDGSNQWQNGYPNPQTILDDIANGAAHVLTENEKIIAYVAIIFDIEPAYTIIEGEWLSDGEYVVVHRVAVSKEVKSKGIATHIFKMIEKLVIEQEIYSIKVDTNFDNIPMLKILDNLGYTYCGEVYFNHSPRRAFEKVLK